VPEASGHPGADGPSILASSVVAAPDSRAASLVSAASDSGRDPVDSQAIVNNSAALPSRPTKDLRMASILSPRSREGEAAVPSTATHTQACPFHRLLEGMVVERSKPCRRIEME
jgi:hypothetical protein